MLVLIICSNRQLASLNADYSPTLLHAYDRDEAFSPGKCMYEIMCSHASPQVMVGVCCLLAKGKNAIKRLMHKQGQN